MQRLSRLSILSLGVWAIMALPSLAETLLYPSAQDKAIMVTGIGLIKAKATSAEVRLSIGEDFPLDAGTAPVPPKPISEKDLNAIVNSLVRSGLKPDQITARIGDATEDGPLVQAVIPGQAGKSHRPQPRSPPQSS
ncbi:MAG: hypothetical protein HC860_04645 [Alkalinema sp. RU_4_3]|nr:hypothetical protein [Alkalinema sp. RU_4_3]